MTTYEKATQIYSGLLKAGDRAESASRGLPTTQGGIDRLKDGQSMIDSAWQAYHAWNPKVDPELPAAIRAVI